MKNPITGGIKVGAEPRHRFPITSQIFNSRPSVFIEIGDDNNQGVSLGTGSGIAYKDFYFIGVVLVGIQGAFKIGFLQKLKNTGSGVDFQKGRVGAGDRKEKAVAIFVGGVEVVQISGGLGNFNTSGCGQATQGRCIINLLNTKLKESEIV